MPELVASIDENGRTGSAGMKKARAMMPKVRTCKPPGAILSASDDTMPERDRPDEWVA
jgi:hypothetical protein